METRGLLVSCALREKVSGSRWPRHRGRTPDTQGGAVCTHSEVGPKTKSAFAVPQRAALTRASAPSQGWGGRAVGHCYSRFAGRPGRPPCEGRAWSGAWGPGPTLTLRRVHGPPQGRLPASEDFEALLAVCLLVPKCGGVADEAQQAARRCSVPGARLRALTL